MTDLAPKRPRGRPRKVVVHKPPVTADDAVIAALERGEEVHATVDSKGETIYQRPVSLSDPGAPVLNPGKRVKVYNTYGAAVFTSDLRIEKHTTAEVLESDLYDKCAEWLIRIV